MTITRPLNTDEASWRRIEASDAPLRRAILRASMLLLRLREETRALHAEVEALVPMLDPSLGLDVYGESHGTGDLQPARQRTPPRRSGASDAADLRCLEDRVEIDVSNEARRSPPSGSPRSSSPSTARDKTRAAASSRAWGSGCSSCGASSSCTGARSTSTRRRGAPCARCGSPSAADSRRASRCSKRLASVRAGRRADTPAGCRFPSSIYMPPRVRSSTHHPSPPRLAPFRCPSTASVRPRDRTLTMPRSKRDTAEGARVRSAAGGVEARSPGRTSHASS
jgi:hypothetical protein